MQASLDDDTFADPAAARFATAKPGAEPLRESVTFVISVTADTATVDPLAFTLFGVDYAVESLAEEDGVVSMVLRGQCPAAYTAETLTIGSRELSPSQSCSDTAELTLMADTQAGTLVDGSVLTLTVVSDHVTTADPSEGMGHRRGSIRGTICALPDTILGESACIPLMLFVPPLVVVGSLLLVVGVTNPLVLSGAGFVTMAGMAALMAPGPLMIVGFVLASLGVGAALLLVRR